jgi:glycosyltransferase involved in cell wall biosynthesis
MVSYHWVAGNSMKNRPISVLCVAANSNFLGFTRHLRSCTVDFLPKEMIDAPWKDSLIKKGLWRLKRDRQIRKSCRRHDVIFCEWADSWAAIVTQLVDDVPIVVRLHLYEIDRPDLLSAINWQNVTMLVVVSDYMRRLVSESSHIQARRCMVIRNGIDLETFAFSPSDSGRLCTYSFFDQPQKRVYDLMLALRDQTLHIGGKGSMSRVMASAIKRFGLHHVLHGYVELPEWLHDKEYFLMHSLDESCGVSLLESMASGLLCLSHDYEASKEILPDRYRYVDDDELWALLAQFRLMDRSERLQVKMEQRRIVETQYDVRDQAARFDSLFRGTVKSGL